MRKIINCVGFILLENDMFLAEKRGPHKRVDPNVLSIPSGGIEDNETAVDTIKREIQEELDLDANKDSMCYLCTIPYFQKEVDFKINYYTVKKWSGTIKLNEAESVQWIKLSDYTKLGPWPDKLAIEILNKKIQASE
jgi:8-oxo-dGTP pyrophosphatase MutT (NUDIX family)